MRNGASLTGTRTVAYVKLGSILLSTAISFVVVESISAQQVSQQYAALQWQRILPDIRACLENKYHVSIQNFVSAGVPPTHPDAQKYIGRCAYEQRFGIDPDQSRLHAGHTEGIAHTTDNSKSRRLHEAWILKLPGGSEECVQTKLSAMGFGLIADLAANNVLPDDHRFIGVFQECQAQADAKLAEFEKEQQKERERAEETKRQARERIMDEEEARQAQYKAARRAEQEREQRIQQSSPIKLEQLYGHWAALPNSDLCPAGSSHWIYTPTTMGLSPDRHHPNGIGDPLVAQYTISEDILTITTMSASGRAAPFMIPYRIVDDKTLEDLRPNNRSFQRRCQPIGASTLLSCEKKYLYSDSIMLKQYFSDDTLPADLSQINEKWSTLQRAAIYLRRVIYLPI